MFRNILFCLVILLILHSCHQNLQEQESGSLELELTRYPGKNPIQAQIMINDDIGNTITAPEAITCMGPHESLLIENIPPGSSYTLSLRLFNKENPDQTLFTAPDKKIEIRMGEITFVNLTPLPELTEDLPWHRRVIKQNPSDSVFWYRIRSDKAGPFSLKIASTETTESVLLSDQGILRDTGEDGFLTYAAATEGEILYAGIYSSRETEINLLLESCSVTEMNMNRELYKNLDKEVFWVTIQTAPETPYGISWQNKQRSINGERLSVYLFSGEWEQIKQWETTDPITPVIFDSGEGGSMYIAFKPEVPGFYSLLCSSDGPAPPSGLNAGQGTMEHAVELSWEESGEAVDYIIYRRLEDDELPACIARTGDLFYTDREADKWNRNYLYSVAALDSNGRTGFPCEEKTGFPRIPSPGNVQVSDGTYSNGVYCTWNPIEGSDTYRIARTMDSFARKPSYETESHNAHFWDTPNTSIYSYGVKAWDPVHEIFSSYGSDLGFCGTEGENGAIEFIGE